MSNEIEIGRIHHQLVQLNAQLHHRHGDLAPSIRLAQAIQLRQALRDLCMAASDWDAGHEAAHQADEAALNNLIGVSPGCESRSRAGRICCLRGSLLMLTTGVGLWHANTTAISDPMA